MKNKAITLIAVGILLFTFCIPSSAHALVGAAALTIWCIGAGVAAIAVAMNEASKSEGVQKDASVQKQEEYGTISPTTMNVQESTG